MHVNKYIHTEKDNCTHADADADSEVLLNGGSDADADV